MAENQGGCCAGVSQIEVEFLVIGTVANAFMMGFSGGRISVLKKQAQPMSSEIVMMISEAFSFFYIFHGIFGKRPIEIIIYIIATLLDVIYCTVDFNMIETPGALEKTRLGVDWIVGSFIPCVVGYLVIRENCFAQLRNVERKEWLNSLLFFDLQLQASSVVFFVTDRQVDVEELAVFILGLLLSLAFFGTGMSLTCCEDRIQNQAQDQDRNRNRNRKSIWLRIAFWLFLGSIPFPILIYKIIKQRGGIASGVYLDVASLVFSVLAMIIRLVIFFIGCCTTMESDDERIPLVGIQNRGGPAAGGGGDDTEPKL